MVGTSPRKYVRIMDEAENSGSSRNSSAAAAPPAGHEGSCGMDVSLENEKALSAGSNEMGSDSHA